jgi:hypothetical protein
MTGSRKTVTEPRRDSYRALGHYWQRATVNERLRGSAELAAGIEAVRAA